MSEHTPPIPKADGNAGSRRSAAGDLTRDHDVAFLTEMLVAAFASILLNWQSLEGYPLREHLEEAARFLGRAVSRAAR